MNKIEQLRKNIEDKLIINMTLEDVVKGVYGSDAKVVIEANEVEKIPSRIHELIDLKNPSNPDLTLTLADLGYSNMNISYYVIPEPGKDKIYIGSNRQLARKSFSPLSVVGYMNQLEKMLNVTLDANTQHTNLIYGKRDWISDAHVPGRGYVEADFKSIDVIEKCEYYNAIKTVDGVVICKDIDCKHNDGFLDDFFEIDKMNITFDYEQNQYMHTLTDVPNDVFEKIQTNLEEILLNIVASHSIVNLQKQASTLIDRIDDKILGRDYYSVANSLTTDYTYIKKRCGEQMKCFPSNPTGESLKEFLNYIDETKKVVATENADKLTMLKNQLNQTLENKKGFEAKVDELYALIKAKQKWWEENDCGLFSSVPDLVDNLSILLLQNPSSDILEKVKQLIKQIEVDICKLEKEHTIEPYYEDQEPIIIVPEDYIATYYSTKSVLNIVRQNLDFANEIVDGKHNNYDSDIENLTEKIKRHNNKISQTNEKFEILIWRSVDMINCLEKCDTTTEEVLNLLSSFDEVAVVSGLEVCNLEEYSKLQDRLFQINHIQSADFITGKEKGTVLTKKRSVN